jgi:hypothetical protein
MKWNQVIVRTVWICFVGLLSVQAQQPRSASETAAASAISSLSNRVAVPRYIKFNGTLNDINGNPLNGTAEVTFTLYKQESDQEPVWTETQVVQFDAKGNYTVLLGATQSEGLPVELFSSTEAHWLGVEPQGQPQPARTLLVSVPYALRAVEAEKLGGKSLSDFVLSDSLSDQVRQVIQQQSLAPAAASVIAPAGAATSSSSSKSATSTNPGPPTVFGGSTTNQIVLVQQSGTGAGLVALTPQNTAVVGHAAGGSGSNGVLGQTGGTTGSGVVGIATSHSLSTNQNGVIGQTAGSGSGVAGFATNTGGGIGVYGQAANFAGVFGNDFATTGYTSGVFGQSANPTGTGVSGSGPATGVYGDSPNGSGVYGQSVGWVGVGGQASATSGTPAYGVWGNSLSSDGVAIAGFADATSGSTIGIYGTDASSGGAGISGYASSASGGTAGVIGQVLSPNGTAGVFINNAGQGLILQGISAGNTVFTVDASGNLNISGNLVVNGTKSSTAKLQDGHEVTLYAVESPENWFEDFGNAELKNGTAWIPLESSFAQAANANVPYHVFLTPNGDSAGIYVSRKTATGFEVREHGGGISTVGFDYRIVARRRGYESLRMAEVSRPKSQVSQRLLTKKPMTVRPVAARPALAPVPPAAFPVAATR